MDTGATTPGTAASSAPRSNYLPSPTRLLAAQPGQAPSIGVRLPQTGFMPAIPHGTDGAPIFNGGSSADSPRSRLHKAARNGDAAEVERMLGAGTLDLNTTDPATGMTALMLAASQGQASTVKLLAKKADINLVNHDEDTALMLAARGGHLDIVLRLLVKGAQTGRRNARGDSALSLAENAGHAILAQLLKALPVTGMAPGPPAAALPAAGERDTGMAALETAGTTTATASTASSISSTSPTLGALPGPATLLEAIERNDTDALIHLMHELRKSGKELAHEVRRVGKLKDLSDPAIRHKEMTPLIAAAYLGHAHLLHLLLDVGARLNQAAGGWTALMVAAYRGHTATVEALLQAGAKVDQPNSGGATALTIAAHSGHSATVHALLQACATIDHATSQGYTALMAAVEGGHTPTVQGLLEEGADCTLKARNGDTALSLAVSGGHTAIVSLLLAHGAGSGT